MSLLICCRCCNAQPVIQLKRAFLAERNDGKLGLGARLPSRRSRLRDYWRRKCCFYLPAGAFWV